MRNILGAQHSSAERSTAEQSGAERSVAQHSNVAPPDHIETHGGAWACLLDLDPESVRIEDIAFSLSNVSRFGGHVRRCVASHSMVVEAAVRLLGGGTGARLHGLLHDAHEAYLGDMCNPLKQQDAMRTYREACDRAQRSILLAFKVAPPTEAEAELVDRCDRACGLLEAEAHLPSRGRRWADEEMVLTAAELRPFLWWQVRTAWEPEVAEERFLCRYFELREEMV